LIQGFIKIDIDNTKVTTEGIIKVKTEVPMKIIDGVSKSLTDYKMGAIDYLPSDDKYDLVVVLGSAKKF